MGRYIEVDSLWKCETCFYHQNGKCNTWCDCGEGYRPAYSKLTIIEGEITTCGEYFDNNIVTNADHFRSMTDEQLAEVIDNSNFCIVPSGFVGTEQCDASSDCKSCILNWLKQPYIKENF